MSVELAVGHQAPVSGDLTGATGVAKSGVVRIWIDVWVVFRGGCCVVPKF